MTTLLQVLEQQKEHAAVVHGQVPPGTRQAPAAAGRHGKGGSVPAVRGAKRSEASDGKAGL
eukprot:7362577-Pyramimonas_sp.AAC.1